MSFGFSIFDIASFVQLTWQVVEGAKAACGEHDDLTKEMVTLHTVLSHVESEMRTPDSILGNKRDNRVRGLRNHIEGCQIHLIRLDRLLSKYNALSKSEKSVQKLWQKAKFGNREIVNVKDVRQKVRTYTDAISITLQLFSSGSQSKVERQLNRQTGSLEGIQKSVNLVLARLTAIGTPDGSVMTDYCGDDKTFWRNLRRELVGEGFSSSALRGQERLIKNYVKELGQRGVLDDRNASTTTLPLIKELKIPRETIDESEDGRPQLKHRHEAENTKAKEVVGVRDIHEKLTKTELEGESSADSESKSSNTLRNDDEEDISDENGEIVLHDGKDESSTDSEGESSNADSDEGREPDKDDGKNVSPVDSKSKSPVRLRICDDEVLSDDRKSLLEDEKDMGEEFSNGDDSDAEDELASSEEEAELVFTPSVVRKFFHQETAVILEPKIDRASTGNPAARVHEMLFQASCEEVLDIDFMPGSHPNVGAPDFPQLCPRSESPAPEKYKLERKDSIVADATRTPETSNTQCKQDKWVFYSNLSLLEPKARAYSFWLQTTFQEFQTRYDEYTTRTRDIIEKIDTLIQMTRKAPSSSDDTYAREISFWSEIVDNHGTEGIIKLLYRRGFEAAFYAEVCGSVIQQAGQVPNDGDLIRHQIPEGYFSSHWDATREPICLNGNVFDAHSLGAHFHLWSAYIWGMSSKQAKTASAFKTEMITFQDAFTETARCLENVYKAGNVYPANQQELISTGNAIWRKLKSSIHTLNIIRPGYYEHESADCRYARAFHDHIGGGRWVELREEMDKFCALVYSELDYEPLEQDGIS